MNCPNAWPLRHPVSQWRPGIGGPPSVCQGGAGQSRHWLEKAVGLTEGAAPMARGGIAVRVLRLFSGDRPDDRRCDARQQGLVGSRVCSERLALSSKAGREAPSHLACMSGCLVTSDRPLYIPSTETAKQMKSLAVQRLKGKPRHMPSSRPGPCLSPLRCSSPTERDRESEEHTGRKRQR